MPYRGRGCPRAGRAPRAEAALRGGHGRRSRPRSLRPRSPRDRRASARRRPRGPGVRRSAQTRAEEVDIGPCERPVAVDRGAQDAADSGGAAALGGLVDRDRGRLRPAADGDVAVANVDRDDEPFAERAVRSVRARPRRRTRRSRRRRGRRPPRAGARHRRPSGCRPRPARRAGAAASAARRTTSGRIRAVARAVEIDEVDERRRRRRGRSRRGRVGRRGDSSPARSRLAGAARHRFRGDRPRVRRGTSSSSSLGVLARYHATMPDQSTGTTFRR